MMTNLSSRIACQLLLFAVLPCLLPAQVDRMSYRHWAWMQQQRRILLTDLLAKQAKQEAVAVALVRNSEQLPLMTIARAIAVARGIEVDAGFLYRTGLQVYALPEVLAKGHELAVTVHAPYSGLTGKLAQPKRFRFELKVTNQKGEVVYRDEIAENQEFRDLREFRSVCKMKLTDMPEGRYVVHVNTILDGELARVTDPAIQVPVSILYDYAARAGSFRMVPQNKAFLATLQKLAAVPSAVLQGAAEYASRAWFGVPGVDPAQAIPELLVAERIRQNVTSGVFCLRGVGGRVSIALPVPGAGAQGDGQKGKGLVFANLRLPSAGLPAKDSAEWKALTKKPLVLAMPAVPALDHDNRRPSFPHFALPSYLAESLHLAGFDSKHDYQLVVVESPGRMPSTERGLEALLQTLSEVFPFDPDRLILVGAGHGATAMVDLALHHPQRVRGLVLVNGTGGLATPRLRKLRHHPILLIPGHGRVSVDDLARLRLYAEHAKKTVGLEILDDRKWPWSIALPLASRDIESFVRRALAK